MFKFAHNQLPSIFSDMFNLNTNIYSYPTLSVLCNSMLLFLFYVNDIPDIVSSTAKMFADDTKVYRKISSKADCDSLQSDLNELAAWSKRWLLEFNAEKCVVLRIRAALNYQYSLNGVYLKEVTSQKDLGITISNSLNQTKHVQELVKKARQKIAMFRCCFTGLDEAKVTTLYQSIVRPALEFASTAWSPYTKKDIEALEKVQTRCLRLCNDKIQLETLQERRMATDLVDTYKFLNRHCKTKPDTFFSTPSKDLRGHSHKLFRRRYTVQAKRNALTNWAI